MTKKTVLMRVPLKFDNTVKRISKKRGYKSNTSFLEEEAVHILENSDHLTTLFGGLFKKKKRK